MMIKASFCVAFGLAVVGVGPLSGATPEEPYEEAMCLDKRGNRTDLSPANIFLSNVREIGGRFYSIRGDRIWIGARPNQTEEIMIFDGLSLTEAASPDSLIMFHADFGGRPLIYWIETREGDLSRNGLLEIDGDSIRPGCVGTIRR